MLNISKIDYLLRPAPIYPLLRPALRRAALRQWRKTARPPAPLELKAQIIRDYAAKYHIRTFIETGAFFGDMIDTLQDHFDALTTIELDSKLAAKAKQRFKDSPKIRVVQGDSGRRLPEILTTFNEPALFWLDGHYSGGVTAKGDVDTPIVAELTHLFSAEPRNHVILIDDARLFGTASDYPSIAKIDSLLKTHRPGWKMSIETDIIRLEPGVSFLAL
jgi:hypothetical protein